MNEIDMCDNSLFADFDDFLNARDVRIHVISPTKILELKILLHSTHMYATKQRKNNRLMTCTLGRSAY